METKEWTARASVLLAGGALLVSINSCRAKDEIDKAQKALDAKIEERAAAPVLAAGVAPDQRGETIEVVTEGGRRIEKPAESVYLTERILVVPVRNVGNGRAAIDGRGSISFQSGCNQKVLTGRFANDSAPIKHRVGYYNVLPGESQQIVIRALNKTWKRTLKNAVASETPRIVVRYTDDLAERDAWTCFWYARSGRSDVAKGARWALKDVTYDPDTEDPGSDGTID